MRLDVNKLMKRENETVQEYLGNRASRYMDSVMNQEYFDGTDQCLTELLSAEDLKRLKNHIYELMQPTIESGISYMINAKKLAEMGEDYASECKLLIWRNFFRYNNPKYIQCDNDFTFGTFIKPYLLEPIRKTYCQHKEISSGQSRKAQMINKAKSYIRAMECKEDEAISEEEIAEYICKVLNNAISVKDVRNTILEMQGKEHYDVYKEYSKKSKEDEIYIKEEAILQDFREFLNGMRPMQQFIFLQSFGYVSHRFENVPITQLIADPYFVRLVKADEVGRNHVEKKDRYTVKRAKKNLERAGAWHLEDVECVDVRFVSNERHRAKEHLLQLVQEKEYSEEEIRANLFGLLEELEEQFEEMLGI